MKKLVFGLIATVMFGLAANANNSITTISFDHSLSIEKIVLATSNINATDI